MISKKIKVHYTFMNKKNVLKKVNFVMDEQLYKDILTLPEQEKDYWMQYYYHEYYNERNNERKEFRHRDIFIKLDKIEIKDDDGNYVNNDKISQVADDTVNEDAIINRLIVKEVLKLLDDMERYIIINVVMYEQSIVSVAKKLGIAESTVRKKKKIALNKIKNKYSF